MLFVGDDWAQDHHDVYLMDEDGARLAARRLPEGLSGVGQLHDMIAAYAGEPDEVIVGIEKDHGLWVGALAAGGYQVYAINPMAVARYRDRHRVSGAKSGGADANCWLIWCAPTGTIIVGWSETAIRPRRSRCWRAHIRI
jgi:hypothetical protein